ncbi:uncharacterized protein [Emydura macquarii macquarii]|uniref:uncharacterized protein n=1 Tax=Emydura macquarii macquarii TaxID=1129001 RepID=UPI00352BA8B8
MVSGTLPCPVPAVPIVSGTLPLCCHAPVPGVLSCNLPPILPCLLLALPSRALCTVLHPQCWAPCPVCCLLDSRNAGQGAPGPSGCALWSHGAARSLTARRRRAAPIHAVKSFPKLLGLLLFRLLSLGWAPGSPRKADHRREEIQLLDTHTQLLPAEGESSSCQQAQTGKDRVYRMWICERYAMPWIVHLRRLQLNSSNWKLESYG